MNYAWFVRLDDSIIENQRIQEELIDLESYAILSNGDPALLLPCSKKNYYPN